MLLSFIQGMEDFVFRASPMIAAGVTVGIIYWAASSYGAFTIMQVQRFITWGKCPGVYPFIKYQLYNARK